MALIPTIETPRLFLRDWRDDDGELWVAMNADPRVTEFFPRNYTRELSESMLEKMRRELGDTGYGWWAVEVRASAALAGAICLREVPFQAHFTPAREIGWRFAFEYWNRGYATEGARAALGFAFDVLRWDEVVAFTVVSNIRSRRVMERLGMSHDAADDFDHPQLEPGHPLRRHVLYRIRKPD